MENKKYTVNGSDFLKKGRTRLGNKYVLGAIVPKHDPDYKGAWDCAEFVAWVVYQSSGILYGTNNKHDVKKADAYTGFFGDDANALGIKISTQQAIQTPGAILLRLSTGKGNIGHVVFSDGKGGTVEAHSSKKGVCEDTVKNRRWDYGILIPGVNYSIISEPVQSTAPARVYKVKTPFMSDDTVKEIQKVLRDSGLKVTVDGIYGHKTAEAVAIYQGEKGLVVDGEVGINTLKEMGIN